MGIVSKLFSLLFFKVKWVKLYLNDAEDYGDDDEFLIIAENTLTKFNKNLIKESEFKS